MQAPSPENPISALPTSLSNFERLRAEKAVYVDKTELVFRLAQLRRGQFFLARPKGFGKSLLLSTFDSLFRHGLEHFEGLAIEALWRDPSRYKVIHLDFSGLTGFSRIEAFRQQLNGMLCSAFKEQDFAYQPDSFVNFNTQLCRWAKAQSSRAFVLLIDEYDAPLQSAAENEELLAQVQRALSPFYAFFKAYNRLWRFFFMTGCTARHESGLSAELNALIDISLDENYSSITGYTREEIQRDFAPHLVFAAKALQIPPQEVLSRIEAHCEDFRFEDEHDYNPASKAAPIVYSPGRVLKFLTNPTQSFKPC